MQNLHRAADDAFLASYARRVRQCNRLTSQGAAFDIDAHLAKLVADIAVDTLSFFGHDLKLRPATPEVHPERQRTPHSTPNPLSKEWVKPDRHRTGQKRADPDVVPAEQVQFERFVAFDPQNGTEVHQVGDSRNRRQQDKDVAVLFESPGPIAFRSAMSEAVPDRLCQCSTGTNVGTVYFPVTNREQRDDNKR